MNERDLMKLSEYFDEAISLCDYTPEEIQEMLELKQNNPQKFKEKYFEFYDDVKSPSLKRQDW